MTKGMFAYSVKMKEEMYIQVLYEDETGVLTVR